MTPDAIQQHDIAIVGAGPAGISMAAEARSAGVGADRILILEKAVEHSFSLKKYYPDGKLVTANYKGFDAVCTGVMCIADSGKQETISYLDQAIRDAGVRIRYNENVATIAKDPEQQRFTISTDRATYESKVVTIAIGILGKPNKPDYKLPPSLKERIHFDLTTSPIEDADVLVVGGGDSASEYCQFLVQKGNRVTLSYRGSEFKRMNHINLASLKALQERNLVEVLMESTITTVRDAGGRPEVVFSKRSPESRSFDAVVYALGGTTPQNFLKAIGIDFIGDRPVVSDGHETNVPGLFLVGDLSAGPKGGSIIWAFNSANTVMRKICQDYLGCAPSV